MRYYIPENILSIAHRGYSAKYKDNTWSAFKNVKQKGFDVIEIDIQLCKSGEIIIYHDLFLKHKRICDLTLKQIKKKKRSIITLKEFFEYFNSDYQKVYLDMKGSCELAHRLFCFLKTYSINLKNIICCSFNKKHLDYLKEKVPNINLGLIISNIFTSEILQKCIKDVNFLIVDWTMLDKEMIDICHMNEVCVFTYTMDGIDAFNHIKNYNIDGIISNHRLFKYDKFLCSFY